LNKKFFLFLIFICIFSVSAVSVHENVTDDMVMINQNDKSALEIDQNAGEIGNFTGLNDEIVKFAGNAYYKSVSKKATIKIS